MNGKLRTALSLKLRSKTSLINLQYSHGISSMALFMRDHIQDFLLESAA
ncbi:hypothetical protein AB4282_08420 [Vibrio lentus]|nr:hypothetical protein [Vibrio lentus]